jgi:hypothetical protein
VDHLCPRAKPEGEKQLWETVERTAHASKERLKERVLASVGDGAGQTANILERWSQKQAELLVDQRR